MELSRSSGPRLMVDYGWALRRKHSSGWLAGSLSGTFELCGTEAGARMREQSSGESRRWVYAQIISVDTVDKGSCS